MAASPKSTGTKPTRARTDGRRTLLVYLDGDLIKALKKVALDEEKNVYEIVEEASREWLTRRVGRGPNKERAPAAQGAKRTRKRGATT